MVVRPIMRGFTAAKFKRDMIYTVVLSTAAVIAHRVFVVEPHKKRYADFYRTYDAKADFERMRAAGVFQFEDETD